ncbi:MAG: hypothetical protein ACI4QW_02765, partial [Clostridia bacterium]
MSIPNVTNPEIAVEHLTRRMFSMRKREDVALLPYTPYQGYNPAWPSFWFGQVLEDFQIGDVAYVAAEMPGPYERELLITVTGDTRISFNGKEPEGYENRGMTSYPVLFREGKNTLIIRHRADSEKLGFEIYIGTDQMPVYWPGGYIYQTRPLIPFGALYGLEGFAYSKAYKPGESLPAMTLDDISWAGPKPPAEVQAIDFDFTARTSLDAASAVSWGKGDICLRHSGPITVMVDGETVYQAESGCFFATVGEEKPFYVVAERSDKG